MIVQNAPEATAHSSSAPKVRLVAAPPLPLPTGPHILLVLDEVAATLGGGERIVQRLARLLPCWGYRVSVLTLALDPASPFLHDVPCPVYLLPLGRTWDARAVRAAMNLRNFLRAEDVRLVQTFFESSDLWVGAVARSVPGIKLIWSRRDMGILRAPKHRVAYRLMRHLPHAVFAVSEQVRRHAVEVDGIDPRRIYTIYNGIDPAGIYPSERSQPGNSPPVVLSVGNIRPVKGFDVLVEAAAMVVYHFPNTMFIVAGKVLDEAHADALRERIKELSLGDQFHFVGEVADVTGMLQRATVFALPSRSEGFSNAIVEAMAQGVPVVATDVGGNAEAVDHEITGLIVLSGQPALLAQALCRLLADESLRRSMGAAGQHRVEVCFSTENMMRLTVETYTRLLS